MEYDRFNEKIGSSASHSSESVFENNLAMLEPFTLEKLSDLIRNLNSSKEAAETLASRL